MKKLLALTFFIALFFTTAGNSQGIFLRIGGGGFAGPAIPGTATQALHLNEIELTSYQEGAGKGCDQLGMCSSVSQSELTVTAQMDISFTKLKEAMIKNTALTIQLAQMGKTGDVNFDKNIIYMEDVQVTGLSASSGGDTPSISISFNSAKWFHTHIPTLGAMPISFGWNFGTNTPFTP